jgi:hypothetical protein
MALSKLSLNVETIRVLREAETRAVVGGTQQTYSWCDSFCPTTWYSTCPSPTYIPNECFTGPANCTESYEVTNQYDTCLRPDSDKGTLPA